MAVQEDWDDDLPAPNATVLKAALSGDWFVINPKTGEADHMTTRDAAVRLCHNHGWRPVDGDGKPLQRLPGMPGRRRRW